MQKAQDLHSHPSHQARRPAAVQTAYQEAACGCVGCMAIDSLSRAPEHLSSPRSSCPQPRRSREGHGAAPNPPLWQCQECPASAATHSRKSAAPAPALFLQHLTRFRNAFAACAEMPMLLAESKCLLQGISWKAQELWWTEGRACCTQHTLEKACKLACHMGMICTKSASKWQTYHDSGSYVYACPAGEDGSKVVTTSKWTM